MRELERLRAELARMDDAITAVEALVQRLAGKISYVAKYRGRPFGSGKGGVYATQSGKFRARVQVDGRQICGPSRDTKARAEQDQQVLLELRNGK